jgi:hypothetical protein
MKETLKNLVQLLNKLECDLNEHKNPIFHLSFLTHEGEPSVTYKINTKLLSMVIRRMRRQYVRNRKTDIYYEPGKAPWEQKTEPPTPPDFAPKSIKSVTYENPKVYTDNIYSKTKETAIVQAEVTGYAGVD